LEPVRQLTRIIGVVSGKGGVGKTSLVVNLGAVLASRHKKDVIIVDCNVTTSHLGMYLGMYYYPVSLNQVLSGDVAIDKAMYDYSIAGLRIIPASLSLDDLKGVEVSELKPSIKNLFGKADMVFLDAAPGFGREALATIRASDEILFVMTPFVPPMMDVIKCYQLAGKYGAKPLGIVMNMVGEGRHELTDYEVEQLVELPIISRIPRDREVLRSLSAKLPVVDFNPKSRASREISRLAAYLAGEEYRPPGILSRVFSRFRKPPRRSLDFSMKPVPQALSS
jgi:MinD-like ATPase involved in chromosome partitioning or flagellar assembly